MKIDVDMSAAVERALDGAYTGGVAGGPYSNTPPAKLQERGFGGEDRLAQSLYCRMAADWSQTAGMFEDAKKRAQKENCDMPVSWDGFEFLVKPTGYKAQKGGPVFRYVLVWEGCSVLLTGKPEWKGDNPNVCVHLGSLFLMSHGGEAAWNEMVKFLAAFGIVVDRAGPSRIDIALDRVGIPVSAFMTHFYQRSFVTRGVCRDTFSGVDDDARAQAVEEYRQHLANGNFDLHSFARGLRDTGFWIGKGLQVAVYDKKRECLPDEIKYQWMCDNRWGGEPDEATRIEFRLDRDALRRFGVETIQDWFRLRASIIAYLVENWFVLTTGHDAEHTERKVIAPLWQSCQELFKSLFAGEIVPLKKVERAAVAWDLLFRQTIGCLGSSIARKHGACASPAKMLEVVSLELEAMLEWVLRKEFRDKVVQKAREFQATVPQFALE